MGPAAVPDNLQFLAWEGSKEDMYAACFANATTAAVLGHHCPALSGKKLESQVVKLISLSLFVFVALPITLRWDINGWIQMIYRRTETIEQNRGQRESGCFHMVIKLH